MERRAVLFLPGMIEPGALTEVLRADDYLIAVDGGIINATRLNVTPQLWVGDFDSASNEDQIRYEHVNREQYPADKDQLDTELALRQVYEQGITQCIIIGGIGGRADHQCTLFLLPLAHPGLSFFHTDGKTALYSICGPMKFAQDFCIGETLSVVPLTPLEGVCLSGVKWPLAEAVLHPGTGYAISNKIMAERVTLSVDKGIGWVMIHNIN